MNFPIFPIFVFGFFLLYPIFKVCPQGIDPVSGFLTGGQDSAVAQRYAQWAKNAADQGRWSEALAALERASDFADVSSDISYLLALARSQENRGRARVLQALNQALYVDNWNLFSREEASLLKADTLIALRAFPQALQELSMVRKSPEEALLTLRALVNFRPEEFRLYMAETLDRYPRESEPVRFFFGYIKNEHDAGRNPRRDDLELLELALRRLPVLLISDPELAWMAAPFMRDRAEAVRLVLAYRAVNEPVPASLPAALLLGLVDEESALDELFTDAGESGIDRALLEEVWELLRLDESRELLRRNLSSYTGVITEDADRDGIPETFAEYSNGMLLLCSYDANQDDVPDLTIFFEAGDPRRALVAMPPETSRTSGMPDSDGLSRGAELRWERYPALLDVELDGAVFIPRPLDFHYSPFIFEELWGSGLLFPIKDPLSAPLTRRLLVSNALRVERSSLEFNGGTEVIELNQGIPVRAREYVGDLMVSETEFLRGRPRLQRVDLNLDGRMDTLRRFRQDNRVVELEDLWDYDRDIEYVVEIEE